MEGQVLVDAAACGQVLQVLVAAVVARHGEEAAVGLRATVLLDQAQRHVEQPDVRLDARLVAAHDDPPVSVEEAPDIIFPQILHIHVGQPREGGEEEEVAHLPLHPRAHRDVHQPDQFVFREIAAVHGRIAVDVGGEGVDGEQAFAPCQRDDVLEGDHIAPDAVGRKAAGRPQPGVEALDERRPDARKGDVVAPVFLLDVACQMAADNPVARIRLMRAAVPHLGGEAVVVALEIGKDAGCFPSHNNFVLVKYQHKISD